MGSGLGKSFVMAHVATVLLLLRKIETVKIIFSEAELRDNERAIVAKMEEFSGRSVNTELMANVTDLELKTG